MSNLHLTETLTRRRSVRKRLCLSTLALAALCALPATQAQDGVRREVGKQSKFTKLVSAEEVESAAAQEYLQLKEEAETERVLVPDNHPQVRRIRTIAERLIPFALEWNPRAKDWNWEVSVIDSEQINAFCMPGGKIAFYSGILEKLQMTDDEAAVVMGHEIAHALREHAREQMGKAAATKVGIGLVSSLFKLGNTGNTVANVTGQLLNLKFGRDDESESDLIGLELAARAGYDPRAGVSLWKKMTAASEGAPPPFLSTHPSGPNRIEEIEKHLPDVVPLYEKAEKPTPVSKAMEEADPPPSTVPTKSAKKRSKRG